LFIRKVPMANLLLPILISGNDKWCSTEWSRMYYGWHHRDGK